ncbi:MAG: hypothetical protein V4510_03545 [bacterium]
MPRLKKGAPPPEPLVTVGIKRGVVDKVDHYLDTHPESAFKNRNEFATHAIADKLRDLEREEHERLLMEAYKSGKAGPLEQLRPKA